MIINILANVYLNSQPDQKKEILNYILETTVGDKIKISETLNNYLDLDQFDTHHINIKAITDHSGDYQIRIREFSEKSPPNVQAVKEEYECINLYYSHINKIFSQKCPTFYQYRYKVNFTKNSDKNRIIPEDEEATPHHIFDCQEYMGEFFLKV